MKKQFLILILTLTLSSCSNQTDKKILNLVQKIDQISIAKFKTIEYGRRGDVDIYTYHINDTSNYSWAYDSKKNQFVFYDNPNFDNFRNEVLDVNIYAKELRFEIESLNVSMISRSPWIGNLIRFWISQTRFVSYVNPDFKFNTSAKKQWSKELNAGVKIKGNWIYVDIEKVE